MENHTHVFIDWTRGGGGGDVRRTLNQGKTPTKNRKYVIRMGAIEASLTVKFSMELNEFMANVIFDF